MNNSASFHWVLLTALSSASLAIVITTCGCGTAGSSPETDESRWSRHSTKVDSILISYLIPSAARNPVEIQNEYVPIQPPSRPNSNSWRLVFSANYDWSNEIPGFTIEAHIVDIDKYDLRDKSDLGKLIEMRREFLREYVESRKQETPSHTLGLEFDDISIGLDTIGTRTCVHEERFYRKNVFRESYLLPLTKGQMLYIEAEYQHGDYRDPEWMSIRRSIVRRMMANVDIQDAVED